MGEHLPCKQGVKSSNLSVSIVDVIKLLQSTLYLENFIQMIIPHRQPIIQIMQIQRQINLLTNHQKTKQQQIKRHRQAAITHNNLQVTIQNRQHQIRQLHLSRLKVSPRSRKHQKKSMLHRDGYFMAVRLEMA